MDGTEQGGPEPLVLIFATAKDADLADDICARLLLKNIVSMAHYWSGLNVMFKSGLETHLDENEVGIILLTRKSLAERAVAEARAMFSSDTPTIVVLDVAGGHAPFLQYVRGSTAHPE